MADDLTDVSADSSTAVIEPTPPTDQAPSAPATPAPAQPDHRVPYERFQSVTRQNQEYRATIARYEQQMRAAQQQTSRGTPLSPEQETEIRQAATALKQILGQDTDLKPLLDLAKRAPELMRGYEGVGQLRDAHAHAHMTRATEYIGALAKAEGLPATPEYLTRLARMVAVEAQQIPDGEARYDRGDFSVLTEAFQTLKTGFISPQQRAATAALVTNKTDAQRIPPPLRTGSPPGVAAPAKPTRVSLGERFRTALMGDHTE